MAVQLASQSQQPPVGSDDGFHSCGSSDEAPIDRIANHIGQLAFHDFGFPFSSTVSKAASDSGASSGGDADHTMVDTRMTDAAPGGGPQLPGAWFYEEAADGGADSADDDAYSMHGIRAALSTRNVTESVEVPSSEHVAEIVGRQGCKIKALRAKTNTYIKTPVRGEEPVFVVTGRQEDVLEAKREIECAAEHFTQIRASRRHSQGGAPAPGHVTAYVRVPLRVVGLVVGPKGATIKRIQQDTHTYIITPSREREPIFEVTGLPSNVEAARKEIEQHIYQRTGNMPITDPSTQLGSFEMPPLAPQQMAVGGQRASYGSLARQQPGQQWPRSGSVSGSGSASGSPPAVSPQLPHMQPVGHPIGMTHYQPWSNAYHSLGIGAEMAGSELFAPRMVSGSMWGGVSQQQQEMCGGMTRDEGLGDSPPMAAMGDAYHLISSIWSTEHTDPLHV